MTYNTQKKMYVYGGRVFIKTSKEEVLRSLKIAPCDKEKSKIKTMLFSENKKYHENI